jgi:hypothetical protein
MTLRVARGDPEVAAPDGRMLRFLAGRTAFTGAGRRLLQGCYADLDELASSLAVLEGVAA